MNCEKCGAEYKVLRDQDDNPIRRLCPCEVLQPCHQCKRGKVNHAQLTRTGQVAAYACAKHGSPDAASWPPPGEDKPSLGRIAAEAMVDGKLKAHGKGATKGSELVSAKPAPKHPFGKLKNKRPLYDARCGPCEIAVLTTFEAHHCHNCGQLMTLHPLGAEAYVDGVYSDSGPRGTTVILTGMIEREEPYAVRAVFIEIPRE